MQADTIQVPYTTRFEEVLWGIMLVALTLVIHGFGMILTLHLTGRYKHRFATTDSFLPGIATVILGSWMIMFVHIVEVVMWAGFFQWKECFHNFSTAVYFAGLEYTTVGSSLNLPKQWRILEFMIASAGLMGFAWSTGVLMTLAQEFQQGQLRVLARRALEGRHEAAPASAGDGRGPP